MTFPILFDFSATRHAVRLSLFFVAASSSHAQAPAASPPVQLTAVDVTANPEKSLTVPSLLDARDALGRTPGGIEVVDRERFARGRASTLEDTFFLSAGVVAQSRFGSDEARLSIRGSGLQRTFHGRGVRMLQDGIPVNLADGSFDMQALEPLAANYITVWRGANALALGASTLGGAIDYISRTARSRAENQVPSATARLEFGSWQYQRAHVAAGAARGDLDAAAAFTHQTQDGFRRHARQENQRLFANGGLRLGTAAETRAYLTAVRTASELPGNLTRAQLAADPRQAAAANLALHQKRDFDLVRLASKTAFRTGETAVDVTAAWTYKDLNHPIGSVVDQLTNDLLLGVSALHAREFAGFAHRLRAGGLLQRGELQAANFVNVAGSRGALTSRARQIATNVEAFAEDQITLARRVTLALGVSASANRRESQQTFGATPSYALDYERVMPKVGLRYDLPEAQLFANVSGSYEPPSFSETLTLNAPRHAQTATTVEVGSRGTHGTVRWEVSIYHARLRRELLSLDHDGNPATPAATINADRTVHRGVEFAGEIDLLGTDLKAQRPPAHRLVLRGAWTYGDFFFDDDPRYGHNTLAGLPPHLIRGELMWESRDGWYAGPIIEWAPQKTFIDFRNTFAARPHAVAACRLGRRSARGLSWFAECRNITDRAYAATTGVIENAAGADQPQFLPGDGLGLFGGIDYRW
jgi:iron complex outermembrane receptor protein